MNKYILELWGEQNELALAHNHCRFQELLEKMKWAYMY